MQKLKLESMLEESLLLLGVHLSPRWYGEQITAEEARKTSSDQDLRFLLPFFHFTPEVHLGEMKQARPSVAMERRPFFTRHSYPERKLFLEYYVFSSESYANYERQADRIIGEGMVSNQVLSVVLDSHPVVSWRINIFHGRQMTRCDIEPGFLRYFRHFRIYGGARNSILRSVEGIGHCEYDEHAINDALLCLFSPVATKRQGKPL